MVFKHAAAAVIPVRQRTQYSCMAASMAMALNALGIQTTEDEVNRVMGCAPMQGASWEEALACAQHYGVRGTLVVPATLAQLKAWTDAGSPVMIGWNPEGRDWSHASLVFDVSPEGLVSVADPNIPDPDQTVRLVPREEFYRKWAEKWPRYMVRRPALALEREVSPEGRQVTAGAKERRSLRDRMRSLRMKNGPQNPGTSSDRKPSPEVWKERLEQGLAGIPGAGRGGPHKDKTQYDRKTNKDPRGFEASGSPLQLQPDYGTRNAMKLLSASDFLAALEGDLDEKAAKFEKGKSMTPEAVSEVVGPEFKENVDNPPEEVQELKEEMQAKTSYLLSSEQFMSELNGGRSAKFERGRSMTIDEVAEVVGPEFKEMNEDPPESVLKVREEMTGKTASNMSNLSCFECGDTKRVQSYDDGDADYVLVFPPGWGAALAPDGTRLGRVKCFECMQAAGKASRLASRRTASAVTVSCYNCNKSARASSVRNDYDEVDIVLELPAGWGAELAMTGDRLGQVFCPACVAETQPPRAASTHRSAASGLYGYTREIESACTGACTRLGKTAQRIAKALYAKDEQSPAFLAAHAKRARSKTAKLLLAAMESLGPLAQLNGKTAARSELGLYGFKEKTARLSVQACTDLHHEIGKTAADLNVRRAAQRELITGFLKQHSKEARCVYSSLLLEAYPDAVEASATAKLAADFLASKEEELEAGDPEATEE